MNQTAPARPAERAKERTFLGARADSAGVLYRVWAPDYSAVQVVYSVNNASRPGITLEREPSGYFSGRDPNAKPGDLYFFSLDGKITAPDPASRFQPLGVFGPSRVVETDYAWKNPKWQRPPLHGRVIYELHVGTFSPEGTYRGAIERLDHIAALGANTIEIMPVADFPGRWNWGYDGVMLYAPARCYGEPDDLRALVDAAHERGLAVVLDVVYNHLGPTGNHLPTFSHYYFHSERENLWGQSLNFDGENSGPVRDFFIQNAIYWLDEFKFDGLRLDATHAIHDRSPRHLMAEISDAAHRRGAFLIAENEFNDAGVVSMSGDVSWDLDGVWADDFHHTVRVALTGQREAHFGSYRGSPDEWVETLVHGWLYRGQVFPHWGKNRGNAAQHLPPEKFVFCISNHDQVGNRAFGDRLHHEIPDTAYRAVSALLCLSPYTPMLFMGQEWAASSPFLYFTDHPGELGEKIGEYRLKEFAHSGITLSPEVLRRMPHPQERKTFENSKLRWDETSRTPHRQMLALYRACLRLRATEPIFQNPPRDLWSVRMIEPGFLALRWSQPGGDWLLVVGVHMEATVLLTDHEFLAPRHNYAWDIVLFTNDREFGGTGLSNPTPGDLSQLRFLGPAAFLLHEKRADA